MSEKVKKAQINAKRMNQMESKNGPLHIKSAQGGDTSHVDWDQLILPNKETMLKECDENLDKSFKGPLRIVLRSSSY